MLTKSARGVTETRTIPVRFVPMVNDAALAGEWPALLDDPEVMVGGLAALSGQHRSPRQLKVAIEWAAAPPLSSRTARCLSPKTGRRQPHVRLWAHRSARRHRVRPMACARSWGLAGSSPAPPVRFSATSSRLLVEGPLGDSRTAIGVVMAIDNVLLLVARALVGRALGPHERPGPRPAPHRRRGPGAGGNGHRRAAVRGAVGMAGLVTAIVVFVRRPQRAAFAVPGARR